jgi:L-xylulokinase
MEEMWQANCAVLNRCFKSPAFPRITLNALLLRPRQGSVPWGKDDHPVRNGIISTDNRAWVTPRCWKERGVTNQVFALSCQQVLASQPVSLLAWLKDNEPEAVEQTKYIFECKDYVRFRLTGSACAELTDYSGANFVNLHTGRYSPELLALFGLGDCLEKLPPLIHSTDIAGYVTREAAERTGLLEGTPVAGGAFDIDACAIAVNVTDENNICMIAGTWSINEYLCKKPVTDGSVMMNSFSFLPEYYLVEECSPTSAGNVEWFISALLPELKSMAERNELSIYDQLNLLGGANAAGNALPDVPSVFNGEQRPSQRHGLLCWHEQFPYAGASCAEHLRGGCFFAPLSFGETASFQNDADKVDSPSRLERPRAPSGRRCLRRDEPAREAVDVNETGALGCAVICAVACGAYDSLGSAADAMCRMSAPRKPILKNVAIYDRNTRSIKKRSRRSTPIGTSCEQRAKRWRFNRKKEKAYGSSNTKNDESAGRLLKERLPSGDRLAPCRTAETTK